jgi:hypothetical protein
MKHSGLFARASLLIFIIFVLVAGNAMAQANPAAQTPPPVSTAPKTPPTTTEPKAATTPVIPASAERHFHQAVLDERDGDVKGAVDEYRAAIK